MAPGGSATGSLLLERDRMRPPLLLVARSALAVAPLLPAHALSSELCDVAPRIGDRERIIQEHCDRSIAALQVGDLRG